ncbi:extracellular solute-binding protein [Williamsia soli]|uniref:extracellular solute-binding protein n=1 Tax=Williamsia soli TaxID=364929 RepID=UPI0027DCD944|nr:extracellular solute-binding protein [Williamsia soli]
MSLPKRVLSFVVVSGLLAVAMACGDPGGGSDVAGRGSILVYSGRDEGLVAPMIDLFSGELDFTVDVDYTGNTHAQVGRMLAEGDDTPAEVFFGQDAAALGLLDDNEMLEPLPEDILALVPARYRSGNGTWIATSARERVLIFNSARVTDAQLPEGIDGLLDPRWRGQITYAPTNASFQSFVTALRVTRGDEAARRWLTNFLANDPIALPDNGSVVQAVTSGQATLGLTNHYYWYPLVLAGSASTVGLHRFTAGDPGALVNVAGAGVVKYSDNKPQAIEFLRELLSEGAQAYFADEAAEYPVVSGVTSTTYELPPLAEVAGLDIDLDELASVAQTRTMLSEVGMV